VYSNILKTAFDFCPISIKPEDKMHVTVTFRHIGSSEALKKYAEEKTERLAKYLVEPIEV
jgi:hypothetical protein